jgi:hypothetical protein
MNKKIAWVVILTALSAFSGCSDQASHKETAKTSGGRMMHTEVTLRLVIRWPGDDFASRQDIETRNKIQNLISERKVGQIISVGTGMGWMDIVVKVKDKEVARSSVIEIMHMAAPTRKFTIE